MIDEENESSVEHVGSVLIPVVKVLVFTNYNPPLKPMEIVFILKTRYT